MKTKFVIETAEELLRVLEVDKEGEEFYSGLRREVKLLYLPYTRTFALVGKDAEYWELGRSLRDEEGARRIFEAIGRKLEISLVYA